jgi:two-component system, NarL family, sensor kinase
MAISKEMGMHESELIALNGLVGYYIVAKKYAVADEYGMQAIALSYKYDLRIERRNLFWQLSNMAYGMQDVKLAEYYADKGIMLNDSLINSRTRKNIIAIEKKYETEKKEAQIKQLVAEKKVQQLSISKKIHLIIF